MRFDDVKNGVWCIPIEAREKGNGGDLRLPTVALEVIREQRKMYPTSQFVFGDVKPLGRVKYRKAEFVAKHGMAAWWIHDLRRTARTLMAAVGVADLTAELVLGHVQKGIQAVYNRHGYEDEKADALQKLVAKLNEIILHDKRKAA